MGSSSWTPLTIEHVSTDEVSAELEDSGELIESTPILLKTESSGFPGGVAYKLEESDEPGATTGDMWGGVLHSSAISPFLRVTVN